MSEIYETTAAARGINTHPVRDVFQQVERGSDDGGHPLPVMETVTDDRLPGYGVTPPAWSDTVMDIIQAGALPFTAEAFYEHAPEGGSGFTAAVVLTDSTIREAVAALADSGQLEAAENVFRAARSGDDPDARTITGYAVATFAKGWLAEQLVAEHDRFAKLGADNDAAGYDLRYYAPGVDRQTGGEDGQLKAVTKIASNGTDALADKEIPHWVYQWTNEGIKWSRAEAGNEMNKEAAAEMGLPATPLKKSCNVGPLGDFPRSARILWPPQE